MKKRILTWLLAISMLGSLLTVPAGAAAVTKFSDVSDSYTATAVESLRLMGVLDGYGDGTFRPDTVLNGHSSARWQFTPWTAAASWDGIPPLPSSRT